MKYRIIYIISLAIFLTACTNYTPKPTAFFRIELKDRTYSYSDSTKPYKFEYPSNIASVIYKQKDENWFDIIYPNYNARLYCSYKTIDNNFRTIAEDSRNFVYKHSFKAEAINEQVYQNPNNNAYGILYEIKGNTASSVQFIITDSTKHFLRGALYFNNHPNYDSLAPVINYIKDDVRIIMETTKWQ